MNHEAYWPLVSVNRAQKERNVNFLPDNINSDFSFAKNDISNRSFMLTTFVAQKIYNGNRLKNAVVGQPIMLLHVI